MSVFGLQRKRVVPSGGSFSERGLRFGCTVCAGIGFVGGGGILQWHCTPRGVLVSDFGSSIFIVKHSVVN